MDDREGCMSRVVEWLFLFYLLKLRRQEKIEAKIERIGIIFQIDYWKVRLYTAMTKNVSDIKHHTKSMNISK